MHPTQNNPIMRLFFAVLISVLSLSPMAQMKDLSLEDAVIGQWTKFRTSSIQGFQWIKNRNAYSEMGKDTLLIHDLDKDTLEILSLSQIVKSHDELGEMKRFPRISWTGPTTFLFSSRKTYYEYNMTEGRSYHLFKLPESGASLDFCDRNYMGAYTDENNLLIATIEGDIKVSDVKIENINYGQAVHRYEFGISKGTFWSPSGSKLAYYRKDERAVTDYPLVDLNSTPAKSNIIKYPMAGDSSHTVTLGVYNLNTNTSFFVQTGQPSDQYLTNIQWGPKEKYIYIALLNRDQNWMKLNQYSADSGTYVRTIFEEKSESYVQPLHPMQFLSNKEGDFLWRTEKSGFDQLYLFNSKEDSLIQLTFGEDVVLDEYGFSQDGSYYYYSRATNSGLGKSIYRVQMDSFKIDTLTELTGTYNAKFHPVGNAMLLSYTDTATPLIQFILDLDSLDRDTLHIADNKLDSLKMGKLKLFQLLSEDSMKMNARLINPSQLDSGKRYPVLVYVYNGPGVQLINNVWRAKAPMWMNYLAEKGFVVLTLDGRGSENRGREFEQVTFRNLGEEEMKDQLIGLDYLKSLDYVDTTKLAVHGWSYGGFMTSSLMLKKPGTFNVGVAGGPVMDWRFYEIMYTERYMDTPQDNPEGYKQASLINKVDSLQGDLLVIHGSVDDVVVPQHSMSFLQAAVSKGVQVDFFTYPMHPHNVRGRDRVHLMQKVISYIEDKLDLN